MLLNITSPVIFQDDSVAHPQKCNLEIFLFHLRLFENRLKKTISCAQAQWPAAMSWETVTQR